MFKLLLDFQNQGPVHLLSSAAVFEEEDQITKQEHKEQYANQ